MKDIIIDLWDGGMLGKSILFLLIFTIAIIPLVIYADIEESKYWQEFKTTHNCKVVGHERGSISTGVGPSFGGNGGVSVVVISNPSKTGWLCDDGITYWR